MRRVGGKAEVVQAPGLRHEVPRRILGVQTDLDGVSRRCDFVLRERQGEARGDLQLPVNQIDSGDHFRDRVLDLQARVHFHEIKTVRSVDLVTFDDELHRAGALIADRLRRGERGFAHGVAYGRGDAGRGCFLDNFLMTPLQRAVAFEQMDRIAVRIGEHLNLDMARPGDELLDQHPVVAERGLGFALRAFQRFREVVRRFDPAHAAAAAAGRRLDQYRIADRCGRVRQLAWILILAVITGHERDAGAFHDCFGVAFGAHGADRVGRRADEYGPGRRDRFREFRVFGKETVARMHRIGAAAADGFGQLIYHQVAGLGRRRADVVGGVGERHMAGLRIRVRINGDGPNSEPPRGVDDAAGDFAPIGDE